MVIESNLKPRKYTEKEVVRIVNMKQLGLYMKHHCYPIDMYTSFGDNGEELIVAIFLKEDTKDLYTLWKNHELV